LDINDQAPLDSARVTSNPELSILSFSFADNQGATWNEMPSLTNSAEGASIGRGNLVFANHRCRALQKVTSMTFPSRRASICLVLLIWCCSLVAQDGAIMAGPTGAANGDWPAYAADLRSTKYSSLDLINPTNFRDLRIVWRWKSPDIDIVKQNPS